MPLMLFDLFFPNTLLQTLVIIRRNYAHLEQCEESQRAETRENQTHF